MDRRNLLSPANIFQSAGLISSTFAANDLQNIQDISLIHIKRRAMATEFGISFPLGTNNAVFMGERCLDLIHQLENQLSAYIPNSEIVTLNKNAFKNPVSVEPQLFQLLSKAKKLSIETNRGFDITSGKLIKMWGFFKGPKRVPTEEEIKEILPLFDSDSLILDKSKNSVFFNKPQIDINLGAIGKGYSLDQVKNLLVNKFGVSSFIISGGRSSILCGDLTDADSKGWPIAINHPLRKDIAIAKVFIKNQALGISAATYNNFEVNGIKYGHVLNPSTGYPANGVATCVVAANDATTADALSTAFYVLGKNAAIEYCQTHKDVGILILPENDKEELLVVGKISVEF